MENSLGVAGSKSFRVHSWGVWVESWLRILLLFLVQHPCYFAVFTHYCLFHSKISLLSKLTNRRVLDDADSYVVFFWGELYKVLNQALPETSLSTNNKQTAPDVTLLQRGGNLKARQLTLHGQVPQRVKSYQIYQDIQRGNIYFT